MGLADFNPWKRRTQSIDVPTCSLSYQCGIRNLRLCGSETEEHDRAVTGPLCDFRLICVSIFS
jgi:hypothetical protein